MILFLNDWAFPMKRLGERFLCRLAQSEILSSTLRYQHWYGEFFNHLPWFWKQIMLFYLMERQEVHSPRLLACHPVWRRVVLEWDGLPGSDGRWLQQRKLGESMMARHQHWPPPWGESDCTEGANGLSLEHIVKFMKVFDIICQKSLDSHLINHSHLQVSTTCPKNKQSFFITSPEGGGWSKYLASREVIFLISYLQVNGRICCRFCGTQAWALWN